MVCLRTGPTRVKYVLTFPDKETASGKNMIDHFPSGKAADRCQPSCPCFDRRAHTHHPSLSTSPHRAQHQQTTHVRELQDCIALSPIHATLLLESVVLLYLSAALLLYKSPSLLLLAVASFPTQGSLMCISGPCRLVATRTSIHHPFCTKPRSCLPPQQWRLLQLRVKDFSVAIKWKRQQKKMCVVW